MPSTQGVKPLLHHKYLWLLLVVVAIDQIVKLVVKATTPHFDVISGLISLTYSTNTGAAFGIFSGQNLTLVFLALIILGAGMVFHEAILKDRDWWCYVLIAAGLIGNLIDRLLYGFVIDFIDFHIWPIFNLADTALTIGVLGVLAYSIIPKKKP